MTSIQDRVNPNRLALDKWSKREQLCLASAVSCSGDQNWMTVSRSLKLLCGANHPQDWFSQKLCAVKYGELLENVETPKRKKRTTSDNAAAAPSIAETPTDSILRRLTEERIQELKSEIREQQETYAKLYTDVVHLQTGNSNEEQIRAMWMEIEREQEQDRKARAQKQVFRHEMQRSWNQDQQQLQMTPMKQEQDMDIDETCKPQGTSPLLSSLLKSSSPAPAAVTTPTTSTVRVSAPTITNLLTGIVSATTTAPSSLSQPHSFQNTPHCKPLTGPAPGNQNPGQVALSPSQSAPTLSMLLEKTKTLPKESPPQQNKPAAVAHLFDEIKSATADASPANVNNETEAALEEDEPMEDGTMTPTKEEEQQLMEVFKNLMPDNIDELADILTNNHGILNPAILEEESILEGVESLMDETQEVDDQLDVKPEEVDLMEEDSEIQQNEKNEIPEEPSAIEDVKNSKEQVSQIESDPKVPKPDDAEVKKIETPPTDEEKCKSNVLDKIETISSDDSSDNVPLSTHTAKDEKSNAVNVEIKDEVSVAVVPKESPVPNLVVIDEDESQPEPEVVPVKVPEDDEKEDDVPPNDDDIDSNKIDQQSQSLDNRKSSLSDSSDVIIIPTDDESNEGKADVKVVKSTESPAAIQGEKIPINLESSVQTNEIEVETSEEAITSICLPDTDDETTNFETPTVTAYKEEKSNTAKQPTQTKKPEPQIENRPEEEIKPALTAVRKLRDRDRSESPLVDDDASDNSATQRLRRRYSSTPVIDSIPNSPVSGDDRELKVWKKSLMTVYNNLLTNKNASIFLRPITDEQNPLFKQVCRRPMDLQIIKRHIESGVIRNVTDFQRDVFLMCQNVIITFKQNSTYATTAKDLMIDFMQLKDQIIDAKMEKMFSSSTSTSSSSPYTPGVKVRGSSRKSTRLP